VNRVETITWIPYPDNKPEKYAWYLVTGINEDGVVYVTSLSFNPSDNKGFFDLNYDAYEDANDNVYEGYENVIAYAELPKGYDPAAPLNFLTALEIWKSKDCIQCRSVVTGEKYWIENGNIMHYNLLMGVDLVESPVFAEIDGEWELV